MGRKKAKRGRRASDTGVNKSQAIRDYQAKNPGDGPKAVAKALKKEGIKVSAAFVSTIKSTDKRKSMGTLASIGDSSMADIFDAKKFVDRAGGIDKAISAVQALRQLQ